MEAFPCDERREPEELEALFGTPNYEFYALVKDGEFVGILEVWEFSNFKFLEHLAIIPTLQGRGFGTFIINDFVGKSDKPVYLEAEYPTTPIAARRVQFYLNSGFIIAPFEYIQPPYYPNKNSVPMVLFVSNNSGIMNIEQVVNIIKEQVYFHS